MKIHCRKLGRSSSAFCVPGQLCPFLVVLFLAVPSVYSVPLNIESPSREVVNNSLADFDAPSVLSKGCRYKAQLYSNGEEVSTDEPCLACQCKGTAVVCKLRICPEIQVPPPPGCIVVHKAKSCCSQLICQADGPKKISREQRFPINNVSNETLFASVSNESKESGYCVLDGTVYAEGSAMRSSTLCQYCFCIRGEMKCSSPQCVIPLNGCKPKFRSYACCPTNYDCAQSNETAVLKTLPSSTQVPQFLKGCLVNNQFVPEGEPVLPVHLAGFGNSSSGGAPTDPVCQTCFCMGGVVHCRPLECDQPIDGCEPIKEDGHCCPDRYDCSKPKLESTTRRTITGKPSYARIITSTEVDDEVGGGTTETLAAGTISTNPVDYYVPVAITTIRGPVYEEEGESTTTMRNDNHPHRRFNKDNEDSFERIATVISGSSEESTSVLPPTTVIAGVDEQPKKKTRVSAATIVGGFKNRSDLGSREERRSKDGDELSLTSKQQLQQQSAEDDEREEYYPVFETTMSNAIDNLGSATTEVVEDIIPEESTIVPETESPQSLVLVGEEGENEKEKSSEAAIASETATESNLILDSDQDYLQHQQQETTIVPRHLDDDVVTVTMDISHADETTEIVTEPTKATSGVAALSTSSPTTTSDNNASSSTTHPTASTSTSGYLEFIPFVEEDALLPLDNDTVVLVDSNGVVGDAVNAHETDAFDKITYDPSSSSSSLQNSDASLLKPLELKFLNGTTEETFVTQGSQEIDDDALPILVEKEDDDEDEESPPTQFNLDNITTNFNLPPGSSSLYNNGYYPHGSIIKDDQDGPADELQISQGQVNSKVSKTNENDEEADFEENPTQSSSSTSTTIASVPSTSTKKPEQPLKAISSIDKFIPSYAPATVQQSNMENVDNHPSRTYSKFGIQDAPLHRYDHHGSPVPMDNNAFAYNSNINNKRPQTTGIYHHRYYNEPEEIPTSRIQNPYNYYNTNNKPSPGGGGGGGGQQSVMGMLPQAYKNNQFFYEDSSAAMDSYEDYEPYIHPHVTSGSSNSIISTPSSVVTPRISYSSTPRSNAGTGSTNFQFLGERVRLPSYNQQRATSTPKYKYAVSNNNRGATSSSFRNKMITTERTPPQAPSLANNDYKHFQAPFPFNLPRNQDDNDLLKSLGIKLSGCNVVGKMYSVGEIIEELSSDCLRCMCSDIGVHCAERKC